MSRSPNSEQKLAIESNKGALLSAGAGSGKTFVIIHHILFLLDEIYEKLDTDLPMEIREKNIARKISEIVVMTFTRKAAGEIKARIKKEIDELAVDSKWQLVQKYYDYMTIGTIDSFCAKVLRTGLITQIDSQFDIVDHAVKEWELERIIRKRVQEFIQESPEFEPIILRRYNEINACFSSIFSDPIIRLTWERNSQKPLTELIDAKSVELILEYHQCADFWQKQWPETLFDEYKDKAWYGPMAEIENLKAHNLFEPQVFKQVVEQLGRITRYTPPRSKKTPIEVIDFCHDFKVFRNCLKAVGEDILATFEQLQDPNSELNKWWSIFQRLFPKVQTDYENITSLSFSDLNIALLKSLDSDAVCQKVANKYRYFILDEFQDTSMIQYQIVERILGGDHKRLFAVGDRKQAIYGFRGGELDVFNRCEKKTSFNHSLLNNYRSLGVITEFNNVFFEKVMKLGVKWEDEDQFQVHFEAQETPIKERQNQGQITCLQIDSDQEWDFENEFIISQLEAELFIKKIKQSPPEKSLAILYSKIKLSFELVEKLIENQIGFTAQVNLELDEEPILELLKNFLTREKDQKSVKYSQLIYHAVLSKLNIKPLIGADEAYEYFLNEKSFWGIKIAFHKLLLKMGVCLSNTQYNLDIFERILMECHADEDRILAMLKLRSQGRFKMELKVGENPERIHIMTAHASKGLEFNIVLLGGIYLNGRSQADRDLVGKIPGSLQWFQGRDNQSKFKTPIYITETIERKYKEFSEKKRLFYVACTRAEDELVWCDFPVEKIRNHDNAWFQPLRKLRSSFDHLVHVESYQDRIEIDIQNIFKKSELPLFHRDNLGVISRGGDFALDYAILPEISVSKLSLVAQCPRKFYLSEVLKLDFKSLLRFDKHPEETESDHVSGVERGSHLHFEIENYLKNDIEPNSDEARWAINQINQFDKDEWRTEAEKLHKFDLFGYMITGIADLVISSEKHKKLKIWDFKTGLRDQDNEKAYWFQLMLYAWNYRDEYTDIEVSLVYLDEKKILSQTLSKLDLFESIDQELQKIRQLFVMNTNHCQKCLFNRLCKA